MNKIRTRLLTVIFLAFVVTATSGCSKTTTLAFWAGYYRGQGNYSKGEQLYRELLLLEQEERGADSSDAALAMRGLAYCLAHQSKYEEAEPLYKKALAIYTGKYGAGDRHTVEVMKWYAELLRSTDRDDEARALDIKVRAAGDKSADKDDSEESSSGSGADRSAEDRHQLSPDSDQTEEKTASQKQGDVDFGPYMASLQRRIKRAWFPPKGDQSKRVVVVFKVHRDGEMSDLKIQKTTGIKSADQAALRAVEDASPFRPLPKGSPQDVDIQFTFDYNVFAGGKKEAVDIQD